MTRSLRLPWHGTAGACALTALACFALGLTDEAAVVPVSAPATVISAPTSNYLLQLVQRWGSRSKLGDLRLEARDSSDFELRLWGGFGLAGTSGTVLRRVSGVWSAYRATARHCDIQVPIGTVETDALRDALEAVARRICPSRQFQGQFVRSSWIELRRLPLPLDPESLRAALERTEMHLLPPEWNRGVMIGGFTYVIEVRAGNLYRASVAPQPTYDRDQWDVVLLDVARILQSALRTGDDTT